ncbi:hypothetical protein NQ315_004767 [Exocentrus adspersus]|uniref:Transcription factor Dp-1 n=1 Tax=Exocentrus adspersus TaxID=1586481 RepID=A0AAV8W2E0_9CUCU|nr:hypothetical protein NQ315_004767 [Exocentrus adspersus]
MTQQTNTTNWVIQGSNGQPQMIKLVQPSGKPISGIMTSTMSGQPVKIFKSPTTHAESSQVFSTSGATTQVLRTIGTTPKIVTKTVPIHISNISRGTKTIRLTPSQMQNIKSIDPSQKLQILTTTTTIPVIHQSSAQNVKNLSNMSPPILSRKRQDPLEMEYTPDSKRARKSEKVGKGLRHFSMKVCEKVKQKGTTTYNEVADELVGEFTNAASNNSLAEQYDQKNIRRRVYDALNLEKEMQKKISSIREKEKQLDDLILNQIAFKNLAQRNKEAEKLHGVPTTNSYIQLPFIVVNTNKKTVINCSISNDKMEYLFQFSDKFEINDDVEILKSIGMLSGLDTGECTPENLEKVKQLIPESLWPYVDKIASGRSNLLDGILETSGAGTSSMLNAEEYVETTMDEENSRQSSSCDPLSPNGAEFSDDEVDSDLSSDTELN